MSDDPRAHDDELVSAVLDGEASPEEVERVASDPDLSARLDAFRRVRDAVAEPVPVLDELSRRRLLDRALEVADETFAVRAVAPPPAPATRRWFRFDPAALGAAAVVAVLALVGALVVARGGLEQDDAASGGADAATEDTFAGDSDERDGETAELMADDAGGPADLGAMGGGDAAPSMPGAERLGLDAGDHPTPEALAAAVRDTVASPLVPTTLGDGPVDGDDGGSAHEEAGPGGPGGPCAAELGTAVASITGADATVVDGHLDGRPVWAVVAADGAGPVILVHLDDCSVVTIDD